MRRVTTTILAALVLVSASPAGAQSGPPEPTESIEPATGTASVETIGPDGLGPVPSPPTGPAWQVGLERSFWNVRDIDLVACGDEGGGGPDANPAPNSHAAYLDYYLEVG